MAKKLLHEQIGCIKGKKPEISKDEIWEEIGKQLIDLQ